MNIMGSSCYIATKSTSISKPSPTYFSARAPKYFFLSFYAVVHIMCILLVHKCIVENTEKVLRKWDIVNYDFGLEKDHYTNTDNA